MRGLELTNNITSEEMVPKALSEPSQRWSCVGEAVKFFLNYWRLSPLLCVFRQFYWIGSLKTYKGFNCVAANTESYHEQPIGPMTSKE